MKYLVVAYTEAPTVTTAHTVTPRSRWGYMTIKGAELLYKYKNEVDTLLKSTFGEMKVFIFLPDGTVGESKVCALQEVSPFVMYKGE